MIQIGSDGRSETALEYIIVQYTNGDAEVSCGAGIGSAQDGSDSVYYPAPTRGASTHGCNAAANFPGGSDIEVGVWSFTTVGGLAATYNDSDDPLGLDGMSYVFEVGDCTARTMDDDGVWSASTLEVVLNEWAA
jgi:hypothetical protein